MAWPRAKKPTIANMGVVAPERTILAGRIRQCPVTCGRPTRMLEATFWRMCERNQEEEGSYCRDMCRGLELPAEIEFIVLNDELQQRGNDMGNVIRKSGVCQVCGQKKIVERVAGIEACSVCTFVARAVKNTPEFVVAELQRQHGASYFPVRVAVDTGEVECLKNELQEVRRIVNLEEGLPLPEKIEAMVNDHVEAKRRLHAAEKVIDDLREVFECGEEASIMATAHMIRKERQRLSDIMWRMSEMMGKDPAGADPIFELGLIMDELHTLRTAVPVEGVLESTGNGREGVLLDLAIDVIAGKISGLDAARISALR